MSVIILRGLPGSGKSHYISKHYANVPVCSADHYWYINDGTYQFDYKKLGEAHNWCMRRFLRLLVHELASEIVVDNTSISAVECAGYASAALSYGHDLQIVTIKIDPEIAFKRNTHQVPLKTIQTMASKLDQQKALFPKYWPHTEIEAKGL